MPEVALGPPAKEPIRKTKLQPNTTTMTTTNQHGTDDAAYRHGATVVGPETEMQERLERAKRSLVIGTEVPPKVATEVPSMQENGETGKAIHNMSLFSKEPESYEKGAFLRPVRDHSGALCWPPCHDPRHESTWLKESGTEAPREASAEPDQLDSHIKEHMRIKTISDEFQLILRKAWMHRTGKETSVIVGEDRPDGGEILARVNHNAAAAKYLEDTHGWSDLLWPVVVAMGDGVMRREHWGNRVPTWPTAHRLWVRFAPLLMKRLERQPFAAYVRELEKTAAYSGTKDDARVEAARLAEIDAKYARRA